MKKPVFIAIGIVVLFSAFLYVRSKTSSSSNSAMLSFFESKSERPVVSASTRKSVDEIFAQVDWDYYASRKIFRTPSQNDSPEVKALRDKYNRLNRELIKIGPAAYPVIVEYVCSSDKVQANMASKFLRDLGELAVEPVLFAIGNPEIPSSNKRTLESLLRYVFRKNDQALKFLSSDNVAERRAVAKLLADRVDRNLGRNYRYAYTRYRHHDRFKEQLLPMSFRPKLFELVKKEPDVETRTYLAVLIATYGEENEEVKGEIINLFKDEKNPQVKAALAMDLGYLATRETVDGAVETFKPLTYTLLTAKSTKLRHSIIDALKIAPDKFNDETVKALTQVSKAPIQSLGYSALEALSKAAQTRSDCLPFIDAALDSNDKDTVKTALEVIPKLENVSSDTISRVLKLATSDEHAYNALRAITKLGPDVADRAIPVLKKVILSDSRERSYAIKALLKMGPKAKSVIPTLEKISKGNDRYAKRDATRAIEKLKAM